MGAFRFGLPPHRPPHGGRAVSFFSRVAKRREAPPTEDRGYQQAITDALVRLTAGETLGEYVAALEISAGQLSRAFSQATVSGNDADAFDPWTLGRIGRDLVESGESVWLRESMGNALQWSHHARTTDLKTWDLTLQDGGAVRAASERVFYVRWNEDSASLQAIGPLAAARTMRQLLGKLEASLHSEAGMRIAQVLAVDQDGEDKTRLNAIAEALKNANGGLAMLPRVVDKNAPPPTRPPYSMQRLGPDIPGSSIAALQEGTRLVLSATGYPPALVEKGDGTAAREAWRRYLHGTVAPLGRLVEHAAGRAMLDVRLGWDRLFASDISGRARAFQSLVKAGMDIEKAAAVSGIMGDSANE